MILAIIRGRQGFRHDDGEMDSSVPKVDDGVVIPETPATIKPVAIVTCTTGNQL